MYSTLAFTSCTLPPSPPTIWSEPRSTDAAWKSGVNRSGVRYRSRINQSNYPDLYVYNEFFNPSLSKLSFICSFNQYFKARRKCSSVKILIVKMWIITAKWNLILNGVQFFYCIVTIKMSWYFYFSIFQAEENRVQYSKRGFTTDPWDMQQVIWRQGKIYWELICNLFVLIFHPHLIITLRLF